jgi:hypothetical protein
MTAVTIIERMFDDPGVEFKGGGGSGVASGRCDGRIASRASIIGPARLALSSRLW